MKALTALREGFEFRLGDGLSSFWFSHWSKVGRLAEQVPYVDIHDLDMRVKDVFVDGNWNFNLLYTTIPRAISDHLKALPLCLNLQVSDCLTWKGNLDGTYTAKDGYYWLNRHEFVRHAADNVSWSWLWHIPAPEKLKFFLWLALHESLPTKSLLCNRGILPTNLCPRCNHSSETTLHCLRDCDFSKCFWHSIGITDSLFFQEDNLYDWLRRRIDGTHIFLFLAACWWLWRARNKLSLENELVSPYTLKLLTVDYANMLSNCFRQHTHIPSTRLITWNAANRRDMVLNVDGSSLGNPGVSGFGGLIRNAAGAWFHGFAGNIGLSNILHAELLALYHGLKMAWDLGFKDVFCYSDSRTVLKLVSETVNDWHHYAAVILNIKELLSRDWRVQIHHTLREGNACADFLAKLGAKNHEAYSSFEEPPAGILNFLLADASGTVFSR